MNQRITNRGSGNRRAIAIRTAAIRPDFTEGGDYAYR